MVINVLEFEASVCISTVCSIAPRYMQAALS